MIEQIIFAEDDKAVREIISIYIRSWGYKVILAENGEEAYKAYKQSREQRNSGKNYLILTDLRMPVMDGLGLARNIREVDRDTKIPILALTGWGAPSSQATNYFNETFLKPPNFAELKEALSKYAMEVN